MVNSGEDGQDVFMPWDQGFQMIAQRLDVPAAILHMPKGCITWNSSQTKQEISLDRDTVLKGRRYTLGIHSIFFYGHRRLYLFPLTGLDEKEFRFASQSRALLGCEVGYDLPNGDEDPV